MGNEVIEIPIGTIGVTGGEENFTVGDASVSTNSEEVTIDVLIGGVNFATVVDERYPREKLRRASCHRQYRCSRR